MNEYVSITLSALSSALGGLVIVIISMLRSDIRDLRSEIKEHAKDISDIRATLGFERRQYPRT